MEPTDASTWHRKWLLLGAALVWGYFLRFRLLGWLVSQALTLALRWRAPRVRARVQIQYISLRPLALGHAEVGGADWRVVCTRVAVATHVLAFFRSFVQKKLVVVAVDDVFVDVLRVDDQLVRDLVRAAHAVARRPTTSAVPPTQRNPMGFMRFIDVHVHSISVNVDTFETRSRVRCSELGVTIPDVFVAQNVLHLRVSAVSVVVSSRQLHASGGTLNRRESMNAGAGGSPHNGLSCELANTSLVFDVRLTDQTVVGCTVETNSDEPAHFHVSTAYVEYLLTKKMELIRNGLFPIPTWIWQSGSDSSASVAMKGPSSSPFTLRVADFPVAVDLVHGAPGGTQLPLQLAMHIRRFEYSKNVNPIQTSEQQQPSSPSLVTSSPNNSAGVQMHLDCQHVSLVHYTDTAHKVVSISWSRVNMDRGSSSQGHMQCEIGELQLAVNPIMCEVLHSLVLFPDVVDDFERSTLALMFEHVAQQQNQSIVAPKPKVPVQWSISVNVEDWCLQSWLSSDQDHAKRDLEAHGKQMTLHSTIPPKLSGLAMKHEVKLSEVAVNVAFQNDLAGPIHMVDEYTIQFANVAVATTKVLTQSTASKSMEISLSASIVILNGHARSQGCTQSSRVPGLKFSNLVFRQTEVESEELVQVVLSLTATEVDATTSHSRHKEIVLELRTLLDILDHVRIMLTPPDPPGSLVKISKEGATKVLELNVSAASIQAQLMDVKDVSAVVSFSLSEMKLQYQKTPKGISNTVTCAFVKMMWDSETVMDVAGVWFDQSVDTHPRVDMLSDVDACSSSDITLSQIQLWLQPERRLVLLFLRLDELVNSNVESEALTTAPVSKKTSKQKLCFNCLKMGIQVRDGKPDLSTDSHDVLLTQVKIQANMVKSSKMTETVLRYLQATRRDESCRSRLADCIQVSGVDGTLSIQSLQVNSVEDEDSLFRVDECLFRFATSDVTTTGESRQPNQSGKEYVPAKFLLFEVSAVAKYLRLKMSPDFKVATKKILPVLQNAVDTRPRGAGEEPDIESSQWLLRYVGSFDCGIQRVVVAVPFANDVFTTAYQSPVDGADRFVMLQVDQIVFSCKQFQKLSLQFDLFRVAVTDNDSEDDLNGSTNMRPSFGDSDLPLQVLLLPRTKLDAAVHWKEQGLNTSSHSQPPEQFAISFDLVLRSSPTSHCDQVPIGEEALLALNWDYIFPALVYLATENDGERQSSGGTNDQAVGEAKTSLDCVGVQWNVSLDCIQIAWWDMMTQESAVLIVMHDILSHGIAKRQPDPDTSASSEPTWILYETTVYLDLFRAYLLREAYAEDEYIALACGALPFQYTSPNRFFVETTGTSYRATHVVSGSEPAPTDGGGGALFGELALVMIDIFHDQFEPVEYNFGNDSRRQSQTEPFSWSAQANPNNGSPPKSPRGWTQSVRAKLARLKRRTSSMDNMLLNDGSRPIQIDSMKLLWTIETRDSAFNTIAVIGDSIDVIMEANRQRHDQRISSVHVDQSTVSAQNAQGTTVIQEGAASIDTSKTGRRGSTRDSLLELLHQGKLGKKGVSDVKSDGSSSSWRSADGEKSHGDVDDMSLSKTIKDKKYTLDVHDVQINILEETTRSSALIASKHIHLEVGVDEPATTTIAILKFECVTGHVAPLDVEVSTGVMWYSQGRNAIHSSGPTRTSSSNSMLLKQVMEEFTLSTIYSQGIGSGETSVEVDMSSLQLSTDRNQFYQLLNVLRHVLLAPPTTINRVKRHATNRRDQQSEASCDDASGAPFQPASAPTHLGKKLHAQLVEELRMRDSKMLGMSRSSQVLLKLISFRSAGCVYRLRAGPESVGGDQEFVEIRAEGVTGSHSYFASQKTKLVVNLEWMEINNLRPGPSSIAFEDAMSVLKAKLLVDQRYQSSSRVHLSNQKGMLSVRAESGPQTRVLGQRLRILDVLEISIFPEIPNMIVIQLAADFYEMLYKFFFEQLSPVDHQETNNDVSLFGKKGSTSALSSTLIPQSPVTKARAYTSPASPTHPATVRRKSIQSSSATVSSLGSESSLSVSSGGTELAADDDDSSADGCELFYFKYVRIGNVRLRINCNGFFVNLNNFDLDLPPYVCQSKLCTWKKLLQKFESHLKWYVTKESASTGLSHFKNKLLKWTPTSSSANEKKEKQKKEDSTTMNAQVLFGPYSGTQ